MVVSSVLAVVIAVTGAWLLTYPDRSDPKNIEYVLWKAGLYKMNLDTSIATMIGDSNRDKLVLGKTKRELERKFGYLSSSADVSAYLSGCYHDSSWNGKDVLFIRNGPWMVVFDRNRATSLVLIKGC